jgi:rod shape determining protein RodA
MRLSLWRNFDLVSFLVIIALVLVGGAMVYSSYEASLGETSRPLMENLLFRQGMFFAIGIVGYLVASTIDYHVFIAMGRGIYIFVLVLLAITASVGRQEFGAQSWLGSQALGFQPSELCKILMVLVLARFLGNNESKMDSLLPLFLSLGMVIVPVIGIYLQSDFGTAAILLTTWLGMLFLAGLRWRHIVLMAAWGLGAIPVIWSQIEDYMRDRILMFLVPDYDPTGASYNINQALISIGSGGWWGKGFLRGTQSQLHFLRVRHTDFIFSVLAEEFGFVGSILLLVLFALLILRLFRAAAAARDVYGRLIAGGVGVMILVQSFVNLGMNANLLPVTGLPLPLVSYGGSSLMNTLLALGFAQSVVMRHQVPQLPLR